MAEGGGFEPPVRKPVRQFSKLVVSATHPSFRKLLAEYSGAVSRLPKECFFVKSDAKVVKLSIVKKEM